MALDHSISWTSLVGEGRGGALFPSLTKFVNLVLGGGMPLPVRLHFFGARLFALSKPGGGLRPIAVGLTLRRLVAKVANTHAVRQCASFLSPRQLDVGVRGGCEAAVHAAR